jgi:hypothetical protein
MAKNTTSEIAKPAPKPELARFVTVLALPNDMPKVLELYAPSYDLIAIVATRDSNDHAAYFRLSN